MKHRRVCVIDICELSRVAKARVISTEKELDIRNDRETFNAILFREMANTKNREGGENRGLYVKEEIPL